MKNSASTARLVQYAFLYFSLYAVFGVLVKYFQSPAIDGFPGFTDLEFLLFSTIGSATVCTAVIAFAQWWRFRWSAREVWPMVLSGTCTALVLPTTTLMYSLPISIMVAMVIMRGSVIVITRLIDTVLLWQRVSRRPVHWEENAAVALALGAVALQLFFARTLDFSFLDSAAARAILIVYVAGYAIRLYLMNYFKMTHTGPRALTNQNYFAVEQLTGLAWILAAVAVLLWIPLELSPWAGAAIAVRTAFDSPPAGWHWAILAGVPFGFAAFFSVFLFMFQGRTSTFSGLVNRAASLLAGTASTLLFALLFDGRWPGAPDWLAFALVVAAIYFLGLAERRNQRS